MFILLLFAAKIKFILITFLFNLDIFLGQASAETDACPKL